LLGPLYPGSRHIRDVGLRDEADGVIWQFAKTNDFVIVSKDSDFQQCSLLHGSPPKFIWVRLDNCSVAESAELLRKHSAAINTFGQDPAQAHLMLP